ncbi:zinc finger protein 616-like isoform X3 [Toxorhynchites rutilus septentrionalis]|uniref:zinc finger protein 616-like isoform X3 n=1 Tax=Toxorhynchites rutilus septentrionalis TaxID=329112 RepID=UPI002478A9F5|nr:zinc finger protein 616-like isoform X3 [Toxorhynchites rutilus septentrionalis]
MSKHMARQYVRRYRKRQAELKAAIKAENPPKKQPKTNAERARNYRDRKRLARNNVGSSAWSAGEGSSKQEFSAYTTMMTKQEERRFKIRLAHEKNPELSHRELAHLLNAPKSTVTRVLKAFNERMTTARKSGSGRRKSRKAFGHNPKSLIRDVGKETGISHFSMQRAKIWFGLSAYNNVQVTPDRDDKDNILAESRATEIQEIGEGVFDVRCIVQHCGMTKCENPSRLFFPAPLSQEERRKWLVQIGAQDTTPSTDSFAVCDLHFELAKDLRNYDDVITEGRPGILKKFVMPTRNIPVPFGHKVVHFSYEFQENTGKVKKELEEEDEYPSLLEEMAPPGTASQSNGPSSGLVLEDPRHIEQNSDQEFLRICRSCLSKDNTLVSVFEDGMDDIFFQFTTISIDENEGISTLICDECKSRLLELQFFRESCVNNTQILIQRYHSFYGGGPPMADTEIDNSMCDYSSDFVTDADSVGLQQEVHVDDPEDLLMPQKEVMETDFWEHEEKPKPKRKQVFSQPAIEPGPVVVAPASSANSSKRKPLVKKRYTCKFCRKEYSSKPGIEMHMDTHKGHNIEDFTLKCGQCSMLRRPDDVHRCYADNLYCHICAEKFRSWSYLKLHLAKLHKIKTKRRELMLQLTKSPRIGCKDDLLKRLVCKIPPKFHPARPKPREIDFSSNSSSNDASAEPTYYKCGFCRACFTSSAAYEKHLCSHAVVQLTQCNECGENFTDFKELQEHHNKHEGDTDELGTGSLQNGCVLCSETFNRRQTLLLHRQYVHRDIDVVECSVCSRFFSNSSELADHECNSGEKVTPEENGGFVIVQPESILNGGSTVPLEVNSEPVVMQEENTDPLLGLGIEEVIDLASDDEELTQEQESFVCAVCGKDFDKEDVLDRHMKLHRMMNAAKAGDTGLGN